MNRRSLLRGGLATALVVPGRHLMADTGVGPLLSTLSGAVFGRPAQGAALYEFQSVIASNFDKHGNFKPTELQSIGGNAINGYVAGNTTSPGASFVAFLNSTDVPRTTQRLFTAHNDNNFEHLVIEIIPPNSQLTVYNSVTGNFEGKAYDVPALRLKAATIIAGTLKISTFLMRIPRWWEGSWQLYTIFLNSALAGSSLSLIANQFIKGYRDPQNEVLDVHVGFPNSDVPTVQLLNQPQVPIPWGQTGYPMLNFTIGGVPAAIGGDLRDTALESVIFNPIRADPLWATGGLVRSNGGFIRQPFGATNLFEPWSGISPIHLTGAVVPGIDVGFGYNGGPQQIEVNGDYLFIDPTFNTVPGNNAIQPASDFGSPFDD